MMPTTVPSPSSPVSMDMKFYSLDFTHDDVVGVTQDLLPDLDFSKTPSPAMSSVNTSPALNLPAQLPYAHGSMATSPMFPVDVVGETPAPVQVSPVIPSRVAKTDSKALDRRARNTEAARRSRNRTKQRISELEQLVDELSRDNAMLRSQLENSKKSD